MQHNAGYREQVQVNDNKLTIQLIAGSRMCEDVMTFFSVCDVVHFQDLQLQHSV